MSDTATSLKNLGNIALISDDKGFSMKVIRALSTPGTSVHPLTTQQAQKPFGFQPNLVLIDDLALQGMARAETLKLLKSEALAEVPFVACSSAPLTEVIFAWLRVGCVDVLAKDDLHEAPFQLRNIRDEMISGALKTNSLKSRALSWARRNQVTGTALVHPQTPFEGKLIFVEGILVSATLGTLAGEGVADHVLQWDELPMAWIPGNAEQETNPNIQLISSYSPKVLIIEDDDALRKIAGKVLELAGYQVQSANDGKTGLEKATKEVWDVIILDLNLPLVDGWAILRNLVEHPTAREAAVVVISAQDELRTALKASRAGARAYLPKTGKSKDLLNVLTQVTTLRRDASAMILARQEYFFDLTSVGATWVLRTMAEFDCDGKLLVEDEIGRYEATILQGQLVEAIAQKGSFRIVGDTAFDALMTSKGRAHFLPMVGSLAPENAPWLFDVVDASAARIVDLHEARLVEMRVRPERLSVNPELAALYSRVAPVRDLKVLHGLRPMSANLAALSDRLGMPIHEVELSLTELLRRGVLAEESPT